MTSHCVSDANTGLRLKGRCYPVGSSPPGAGFSRQYICGIITKWVSISGTTVASSQTRFSSSIHRWHHHPLFPSPIRAFASRGGFPSLMRRWHHRKMGFHLRYNGGVIADWVSSSIHRWHHHTGFPSPIRAFASRGGSNQSGLRLEQWVSVADTSVASSRNGFLRRHNGTSFGGFFLTLLSDTSFNTSFTSMRNRWFRFHR